LISGFAQVGIAKRVGEISICDICGDVDRDIESERDLRGDGRHGEHTHNNDEKRYQERTLHDQSPACSYF